MCSAFEEIHTRRRVNCFVFFTPNYSLLNVAVLKNINKKHYSRKSRPTGATMDFTLVPTITFRSAVVGPETIDETDVLSANPTCGASSVRRAAYPYHARIRDGTMRLSLGRGARAVYATTKTRRRPSDIDVRSSSPPPMVLSIIFPFRFPPVLPGARQKGENIILLYVFRSNCVSTPHYIPTKNRWKLAANSTVYVSREFIVDAISANGSTKQKQIYTHTYYIRLHFQVIVNCVTFGLSFRDKVGLDTIPIFR